MYRADVIREAVDAYDHEEFFGRPVKFSDDSLLTTYAYMRGKTVQQISSYAFTVLPENPSHHLRQQLRWMRGSFIRSWWRFKYLPLFSFAYWEHFLSWVNFMLVSMAFITLFVYEPIIDHRILPFMFVFSILTAYATALRYLLIRRSDQSIWYQLGTLSMVPLMLVWTAVVLRPLRIYSMLTCLRTGWGTRGKVEVTL